MFSTIMIIPDPLKADANLLGAALGYGNDNYAIEIPTGGPATHWAGHSYATAAFFARLLLAQGVAPAEVIADFAPYGVSPSAVADMGVELGAINYADFGLSPEDVKEVLDNLLVSAPGSPLDPEGVPYASPTEHFAAVAASLVSEA
jgi:hypothetical protein